MKIAKQLEIIRESILFYRDHYDIDRGFQVGDFVCYGQDADLRQMRDGDKPIGIAIGITANMDCGSLIRYEIDVLNDNKRYKYHQYKL